MNKMNSKFNEFHDVIVFGVDCGASKIANMPSKFRHKHVYTNEFYAIHYNLFIFVWNFFNSVYAVDLHVSMYRLANPKVERMQKRQ